MSTSKIGLFFRLSEIFEAARLGKLNEINFLLENDRELVDELGSNHNNALFVAVEHGHFDIVVRLLEFKSVQLNIAVNDNYILRTALQKGNLDIINRLLEFDAVKNNLQIIEFSGMIQPLVAAVHSGNLEIVNRILEFRPILDDIAINNNDAAFTAALFGYHAIFKHLLTFKAVQKDLLNYISPAVSSGNVKILNDLLQFDSVRENMKNQNNDLLITAVISGNIHMVNKILEIENIRKTVADNNNSAAFNAFAYSYFDILDRLLEFEEVRQAVLSCAEKGEGGKRDFYEYVQRKEQEKTNNKRSNNFLIRFKWQPLTPKKIKKISRSKMN